jgi:hexosaminidase
LCAVAAFAHKSPLNATAAAPSPVPASIEARDKQVATPVGHAEISIIPQPASIKLTTGEFVFDAKTRIVAQRGTRAPAERLRESLYPATGYPLEISTSGPANAITLSLDTRLKRLGPEGYRLEAQRGSIRIRAFAPAGIFYGIQTLRQLLPPEIFRRSPVSEMRWSIPAVEIEDSPRFSWRGAHMDVARHFMPREFVLKFLDLMALHKLNVFHWHLVDGEGWRVEIKKYPKLTEVGGKTDYTTYSPNLQPMKRVSLPQGGFYTQDDIREVVRYAADRFITVLPEIEMPGHSKAAINAYPELGNREQIAAAGKDPDQVKGVDDVYNVDASTIHFLQDVLAEITGLFPGKFIHIGGDEVDKEPWKANPIAQQRMHELNLKNEEELQSWFVRQMDQFLTARGRRLVGWDEILEGGIAPGATIMSWRGTEGGIKAANAGHDVVMAPESDTYLDHYQWMAASTEPRAIGGFLALESVYAFEPVPTELTPAAAKHILGGQAQLWSEYIPQQKEMEYMAYPRLCALAEAVWTPRDSKHLQDFLRRMKTEAERLEILDVHFHPLSAVPEPVAHWEWNLPLPIASKQPGEVQPDSGEPTPIEKRVPPPPFEEREWDVTQLIHGAGFYDTAFIQAKGTGHMDIAWVELRSGDQLVARITHPGSSDPRERSNDYELLVNETKSGAPYKLRARFRVIDITAPTKPAEKVFPSGEIYILGPYQKKPEPKLTQR